MSLIDSFKTDEIAVTRFDSGTLVKGRYQKGNETNLTLQAVVLPVSGKERLQLPETIRTTEIIRLYTKEALLTANESESKKADTIEWHGQSYQVHKVEHWNQTDIPHYKSFAVKIEKNVNERRVK